MSTAQQGLEVLAPCPDQPTQSPINVDIIAVPGLGADPSKSFGSETPGGFNWLKNEREGIRSDMPGARILLYHYESRWLGADAKQQTLYNVASLLLDSLVEKRKGGDAAEATRPIVFLAHSMGGLVVAKALTLAAAQPEKIEYMRIFECFAGGIFFGTPFKGSSAQARALLLATFLEHVGGAIPTQMVQLLEPGRDSLEELRRDFVNLSFKEPKANIACIFEQAKTNYMKEKISAWVPKNHFKLGPEEIVVTQDSATIDGAVVRGLACNHRQLNRFDSAKDGRYEVVRHHLKDIVKNSQLVVKARLRASRQSVVDDTTFQRLSESLNVVDFQRKRRGADNLSGDSSWILEEPKYVHWSTQTDSTQPPANPCLWVSGDEGLGKSKAAVTVVDELKKREANNLVLGARDVMVAYFFCDSTPDGSVAENILKSLIWQLILKRRSLAQYVKTFAAQNPNKSRGGGHAASGQFSLSKLWKGLTEMLRDPSVHEVYFIVNNIHYLSKEQPSTIEFLRAIPEVLLAEAGSVDDPIRDKVRWLFLSRDRANIKAVLQEENELGSLRINMNDSSMSNLRRQHLRSYTRDRVKTLAAAKNYSLALQYFVFSSLEKRAESNTLWVEVVCCLLGELPPNFVNARKTLGLLPQDLNELINRTWTEQLTDADKEGIETTKEILRTLVVAYEDPTLQELAVLAELDADLTADDAEAKILEQVRACGPLLRVYDMDTWNDTIGYRRVTRVTFIHPLAKDALVKLELRSLIGLAGEDEDDKTEIEWQHGIVGLRCFSYMLKELGGGDEDTLTLQRTAPTEESQASAEIDELFPEEGEEEPEDDSVDVYALEYPLKYWLRHGYKATPDFVDTLDIKHRFWSLDSSARKRWWGSYSSKEYDGELKKMTALHIAAFFGLLPLVDSLLADGHADEINSLDSWDNQPLHWAASCGHIEVCERLLEKGADINNGRETGAWTPLHMAASEDRVEVMQMLISYDKAGRPADVNAVAKEVGTPLTLALAWRQTKAAELLLEHDADTTLTAEDADPPVAVAVLGGYEALVDKLLQAGGDANITSREYGSALAAAASTGNANIVKTLLALDENPASRQRALKEASFGGFPAVVDVILRSGSGLPLDEAFGKAAFYGHDQIVTQLWNSREENAISPEAVNTALYMATDAQQESTIKFLLQECRANPNAVGEEYGNALTASAFDGTESILQTLIKYGADINAPEGYPLQAAAANGHTEMVTLLLNHGADVNGFSKRAAAGTALQEACVAGNVDVAKVLLARRANPNYGAGDFTNPLVAATSHGYGELVELLLKAGANPNVFGGADGSTPLINAAMALPSKSLELLIQHGAVVDQKDPDEDTALIISALVGDSDCVKVLLDHGAHIDLSGKHNGSALHAAAASGHTATCQLLLERGADPNVHAGPYNTVLQAAAASDTPECLKVILAHAEDIDVDVQGGDHVTAIHAAAVQEDDGGLRQLLAKDPNLDVSPSPRGPAAKIGTPLQAAAFAGCNRNARLLLEAGADPNVVSGKHGTALQAAVLKGDTALCKLLLSNEARVDVWAGKYGSPLVAAVVREDDADDQGRYDVLNLLLEQDGLPPNAYTAALETALKLKRKEDFKLILEALKIRATKEPKKFPNVKGMLSQFKRDERHRHVILANQAKQANHVPVEDDKNSDFGDDVVNRYQDIDDVEVESEPEEAAEDETARGDVQQTRGVGGEAGSWQEGGTRSRGFNPGGDGQQGDSGEKSRGGAGAGALGAAVGGLIGAIGGASAARGFQDDDDEHVASRGMGALDEDEHVRARGGFEAEGEEQAEERVEYEEQQEEEQQEEEQQEEEQQEEEQQEEEEEQQEEEEEQQEEEQEEQEEREEQQEEEEQQVEEQEEEEEQQEEEQAEEEEAEEE
ncbi:hypothetical protein AK830_g1415 [Neonectria ditissima]|uniref:Nephrocystin 3-like N-terminal domain-containing protein n=1 Tax=Neonectria ditissima TaxID=78410 RepID=A0A0P7BJ11_9HYPO|nr:hypothetical protein AK830_g1415 [Neonectria ditissima]